MKSEKSARRFYVQDRNGLYWSKLNGWVRSQKHAVIVKGTAEAVWRFVDEMVDEEDEGIFLTPV
jgi:hypothetical protein